jgi:hypothetical protein
VAEGHALGYPIGIGAVHDGGFAEATPAFGALGLAEVPSPGAAAEHFAVGGDLESLGGGLLCFDAFGTSHKILKFVSEKERAI